MTTTRVPDLSLPKEGAVPGLEPDAGPGPPERTWSHDVDVMLGPDRHDSSTRREADRCSRDCPTQSSSMRCDQVIQTPGPFSGADTSRTPTPGRLGPRRARSPASLARPRPAPGRVGRRGPRRTTTDPVLHLEPRRRPRRRTVPGQTPRRPSRATTPQEVRRAHQTAPSGHSLQRVHTADTYGILSNTSTSRS